MKKINVNYSKQARKFLKKQAIDTQERILTSIRKIPTGEIKITTVVGYPHLLKIRIGAFRVIFDKDFTQIIEVREIGNRGDIYKGY